MKVCEVWIIFQITKIAWHIWCWLQQRRQFREHRNEVIKKSTIVLWYRWIGQKLTEMHLISRSTISRFHRDEIKQEVDRMAFLFSSILMKEADIDWTWNYIGWAYRIYNILSIFIITKYFKFEFIINLILLFEFSN